MNISTLINQSVIQLDVTERQVVGQPSTQNVVQIDRKPVFQDVSKVYGPPGLAGAKGDPGPPGAAGRDGQDGAPGIGAYTASFPIEIEQAQIKLDQVFIDQNIYLQDGGDF